MIFAILCIGLSILTSELMQAAIFLNDALKLNSGTLKLDIPPVIRIALKSGHLRSLQTVHSKATAVKVIPRLPPHSGIRLIEERYVCQ